MGIDQAAQLAAGVSPILIGLRSADSGETYQSAMRQLADMRELVEQVATTLVDKMQAKAARTAGYYGAGTSLLTGASRLGRRGRRGGPQEGGAGAGHGAALAGRAPAGGRRGQRGHEPGGAGVPRHARHVAGFAGPG